MSRCFPFPPPGYENKAKVDDVELFAKEKHKEKNHKKEKDKEKREREKKDKERIKDKHKEKKEWKEKHKNKKDKDRERENGTFDNKIAEGRSDSQNEVKLGQSSWWVKNFNESKFVEELGKRIRDEAAAARIQVVGGDFTGPDRRTIECVFTSRGQKRIENFDKKVEKDCEKRAEGKEGKEEGVDGKPERQRDKDDGRITRNKMGQNVTGMDQKSQGVVRPQDQDNQKMFEGKKKHKNKKNKENGNRRGDKHGDKEREEKKKKGKDKDKDKVKEKEKEKLKEIGDHKHIEHDILRGNQREQKIKLNAKSPLPPKDSDKSAASEGSLLKRKDFKANGFINEHDLRPCKLQKPSSSPHIPMENGRKFELPNLSVHRTSDRQRVSDSKNGDMKEEHKVIGIIEVQPLARLSRLPFATEPCGNCGASSRQPHPDSKYLSQILSIPKMAEWSDFEDQEWLFTSNGLQSKPKDACRAAETPQVWEEAVLIESADMYALPYVIPR